VFKRRQNVKPGWNMSLTYSKLSKMLLNLICSRRKVMQTPYSCSPKFGMITGAISVAERFLILLKMLYGFCLYVLYSHASSCELAHHNSVRILHPNVAQLIKLLGDRWYHLSYSVATSYV
jgi:hypothetical protein